MLHAAQATPRALLDLLFPPRCVCCRRGGAWFCADCRARIEPIPAPVCDACGRPLVSAHCSFCAIHSPQIDGVRAVAFFERHLREAIHALKYDHRPELAPILGRLLSDHLAGLTWRVDAIVAVPLHQARERARGYNQARLLAHSLATAHQLPIWDDALTRTRSTRPQVELNARERRANVQDAFSASARVAGAHIVLVDDVCTTGVTLEACSIALKARGAQAVYGLALARPRLE
ncbi:MAG: ComF family protein [Chloroflexi bacterium]|nr:ComF family protein [Chloroflexota bacterium]